MSGSFEPTAIVLWRPTKNEPGVRSRRSLRNLIRHSSLYRSTSTANGALSGGPNRLSHNRLIAEIKSSLVAGASASVVVDGRRNREGRGLRTSSKNIRGGSSHSSPDFG